MTNRTDLEHAIEALAVSAFDRAALRAESDDVNRLDFARAIREEINDNFAGVLRALETPEPRFDPPDEDDSQPEFRPGAIFAQRRGYCSVCRARIQVGDLIVSAGPRAWAHEECAALDAEPTPDPRERRALATTEGANQ